jgi:hypothetical protein
MLVSDKRRPIAAILLLVNVGLVVLAAAWRHASADDSESTRADSTQTEATDPSASAPLVELPAADEAQGTVPDSRPSAPLANDAVMDELRTLIRDPSSGLDVPRLDTTSPLASRAKPLPASDQAAGLQQRIETIQSLSTAALALVREARQRSAAGQAAESAALMQHVTELRLMIASLAAQADDRP